ncbi:MAG: L,D-transpeptidase [Verrucomicrobia bacterium]|nr:L,D-transpeptidase [Verrucomicrobiota bacterium]
MKISRFLFTSASALVLLFLGGCQTPMGNPNPPAYKPHNPANVRVKVSLSKQQVYVMEGERPLLVAATCVGKPGGTRTPCGDFRVFSKIAHKRSGSYGFYRNGGQIVEAQAGHGSGTYIGYPMAYWVEFTTGYGFHEGFVWPVPRTHGCLRLHQNVAAKFYALVREGTPVNIAQSQPEDLTIGRNVPRPVDYNDPDRPANILCSDAAFTAPAGPLLIEQ